MDYYSYMGEYITIDNYTIEVLASTSILSEYEKDIDINYMSLEDNIIKISITSPIRKKTILTISNMMGKRIYESPINILKGTHHYSIDAFINTGFYIATICNDTKCLSTKILVLPK